MIDASADAVLFVVVPVLLVILTIGNGWLAYRDWRRRRAGLRSRWQ